jgi:hypothetical protein
MVARPEESIISACIEEMIEMTLLDQHRSIESRADFVAFVRALRQDLLESPQTWENDTLDRFLGGLSAWVEDMDGYYVNQGKPVPRQIDWKVLADIMMGAKIYE